MFLIHRARGRPHNGFDFTLHDEHNLIAGVKAQSISDGLRNSNQTFTYLLISCLFYFNRRAVW